jgi:hypothetical protein
MERDHADGWQCLCLMYAVVSTSHTPPSVWPSLGITAVHFGITAVHFGITTAH